MSGIVNARETAPGFIGRALASKHSQRISALMASVSLIFWAVSIIQAKGEVMGDYGLFSVLPATYYLGVFLLLASMFYTVFSSKYNADRSYLKLFLLQSFILMAFMLFTPTLIEGTARSPHSWLKFGYADYIVRTGHISQAVTHYHNWPAPFIYTAELVLASSLGPEWFPAVFPLVLDMMVFAAVAVFCLRFFKTAGARYMAIMLFFLLTWENQFHYVPQLFAFLLFLLIVYLGIFYLKKDNVLMLAVMGMLFAVLLLTHLLTAFVAGVFLGIMVLLMLWPGSRSARSGRRRRSLWRVLRLKFWMRKVRRLRATLLAHKRVVAIVAVIGIFGAAAWYMFARDWITYAFHGASPNVWPIMISAYVEKLYTGSEAHGNLALMRMAFTALIAGLAVVGGKIAYDRGKTRAAYAVAIAGIAPVFLFYYEAEILQRSLLFCGLAVAVLITLGAQRRKFLAVAMVLCFLAVPIHTLAMYGNEKIDYTPPSQIPGAEFVFDSIPSGIIVSGNQVEGREYIERYGRTDISRVDRYLGGDSHVYVVRSSSSDYFSLWYLGDDSSVNRQETVVARRGSNLLFCSPDCRIYMLG